MPASRQTTGQDGVRSCVPWEGGARVAWCVDEKAGGVGGWGADWNKYVRKPVADVAPLAAPARTS